LFLSEHLPLSQHNMIYVFSLLVLIQCLSASLRALPRLSKLELRSRASRAQRAFSRHPRMSKLRLAGRVGLWDGTGFSNVKYTSQTLTLLHQTSFFPPKQNGKERRRARREGTVWRACGGAGDSPLVRKAGMAAGRAGGACATS
jgi:hypothetical protein